MSLKAGRVGVNPKDVNPIDGSILQSSAVYTKEESDAKFGSIHVFKTEGTANVTTWETAMNAIITAAGGASKLAELLTDAIATFTVILKNATSGDIVNENVASMTGIQAFTSYALYDDGEDPVLQAGFEANIFNFYNVKRYRRALEFTLATGACEYISADTTSNKISSSRNSELVLTIVKKEED